MKDVILLLVLAMMAFFVYIVGVSFVGIMGGKG